MLRRSPHHPGRHGASGRHPAGGLCSGLLTKSIYPHLTVFHPRSLPEADSRFEYRSQRHMQIHVKETDFI